MENFVKSSYLDNLKKHIKKIHPEFIPDKPYIEQGVANKQSKYNGAELISIVKFMKPVLKKHKVDIYHMVVPKWYSIQCFDFS